MPHIKIAIIEDDPIIAQMYRMKFEAEGFEVETASDGKVGINLVRDMQPDAVLLDLKMPVMSGEAALAEIRKQEWGREVPVIILTNLGEEEAPKNLAHLNVHSYIVKAEMTPRQVTEHVKKMLAGLQQKAA